MYKFSVAAKNALNVSRKVITLKLQEHSVTRL